MNTRSPYPQNSISATLAKWSTSLQAVDLPEDIRTLVANAFLDSTGLMFSCRREGYIGALIESWNSPGPCTIVGHAHAVDMTSAAMINGTAVHGEDYDDTFTPGQVHPTSPVMPAVLAVCEATGRSGADALLGCAVGMELTCRLAVVSPTAAHRAGFHPTAIIGAMGAAAGVCSALRMSADQYVNALGIAGSFASGIIEYLSDGSSTKRMHPGWAGQSGIRAALMARSGFTGPRTVFEGKHGFFHAFGDPDVSVDLDAITNQLGSSWLLREDTFKAYACGAITQPYIDCAVELRKRGVLAKDIQSIDCEVGEGTVHRLWEPIAEKRSPSTPYSAKFSIPYCVAVGFLFGDAGLAQFTDETVRDPDILSLAQRVSYTVDQNSEYPKNYTGHLRAVIQDGTVIEIRQDHMRGGKRHPLLPDELEQKFARNVLFGGVPSDRISEIKHVCRTIFDADDLSSLGKFRIP